MEARTDGYLYGPNGGDEAFAIVETKAHCRARTGQAKEIYMQESAEMVAWIRKDKRAGRDVPLDNKRLLLAQDRDEIYLIWASYNASYVDYLEGTTSANVFMKMNEIGPFKTQDAAHMRRLAEYIGSFCHHITETMHEEETEKEAMDSNHWYPYFMYILFMDQDLHFGSSGKMFGRGPRYQL